jgi:flagellar biosynthesis protein FlhG
MAKTIGVCSGKGGVGKTYCAVNLSRYLSLKGKKVLLIDCDFNLGNCGFLLGISNYKTLVDFSKSENYEDCITKSGEFDFVGAESGDLKVLENSVNITESLLKLIWSAQKNYDYIILDFGAGLDEKLLSILAFCDQRLVIMNSDKLSLKDSYALIKVLKIKYGVVDFHVLPNKVKDNLAWDKIRNAMCGMNDKFLQINLTYLAYVSHIRRNSDPFCRRNLGESVAVGYEFNKAFNFLVEMNDEKEVPFWIRPKKQDAFFERLRSN